MASSSEDIAKRMADLKARRRYWPEGEPGSRRNRDRKSDKDRDKTDPSESKASTDPRFKRRSKSEPEKLEPISEFVRKERARRFEHALKEMEERRVVPKDVPLKKWLNEPANLKRALKRGMVTRIAKHANPKSKDTEDVVTVGGSRYAKTDLYRAPLRERASEVVLKTKFGSEVWWDRNKKVIFVAALSTVVGFMAYTVWKNRELQENLQKQRVRRRALAAHKPSLSQHTGLLAMPAHHWHQPMPFFPGFFRGQGNWCGPGGWGTWTGAHGGGGGGGGAHGGPGAGRGGGGGGALGGHGGVAMSAPHGQGGVAAFAHQGQGYGERGWGGGGGWGGWGGWGWDASPWYADQFPFGDFQGSYSWDPYDSYDDPFASWW